MLPNIHLLGIQGSGKGTQAARLVEAFGLTYVGSGNLLRERASRSDDFAKELARLLKAGTLVPDEYLAKTVRTVLSEPEGLVGIVADGVIRTVEQYRLLKPVWEEFGLDAPHVVYLQLSEKVAIERIKTRRQEAERGERLEHHQKYSGKLLQRTDDNPASLEHRFELFHALTKPLVAVFDQAGNCAHVDASLSVDEVFDGVQAAVTTWYPRLGHAA